MIAVLIGPPCQCLAYAAATSYLAQRATPLIPYDLLMHDTIRLRFSSGALVGWTFERGDEPVTIDPRGRLIIGVDAAPAAIAAARAEAIAPSGTKDVLRAAFRCWRARGPAAHR